MGKNAPFGISGLSKKDGDEFIQVFGDATKNMKMIWVSTAGVAIQGQWISDGTTSTFSATTGSLVANFMAHCGYEARHADDKTVSCVTDPLHLHIEFSLITHRTMKRKSVAE